MYSFLKDMGIWFENLFGPRKTSTKVVSKFILFSAGVLLIGLVSLQWRYMYTSIQQTEVLLSRRSKKPLPVQAMEKIHRMRHAEDGTITPVNAPCFELYETSFCRADAKKIPFSKHIYNIGESHFIVKIDGRQKIIQDITEIMEMREHIFRYSLWIFLFYLLISYPLGIWFLRSIYAKLFQAMEHLEADEEIDISAMQLAPHDELRLLFEKINTSMESIKQFNSYVSHEIKTPLMMAHSHLDVMKAQLEKKSYDALKTKIPQMQKNLQEVAEIIDVLGKFILIENKSYDEEQEEIDVCEVLRLLWREYENQLRERNIDLEISSCEGKLTTNSILFTLLLRNLIDNAVKYALAPLGKSKAKIFVVLHPAWLSIKNTAKKPEDLEALSEKFYKEGSESGLGLGLYLVKKIVDLLGWRMSIGYEEGVFEVNIRLKNGKMEILKD